MRKRALRLLSIHRRVDRMRGSFLRFQWAGMAVSVSLPGRVVMLRIEKFRARVRQRKRGIIQRRQRGESARDLAKRYRISRSRVDAILKEFETAEVSAKNNRQLLASIRAADDLDRPWPVSDLISAIGPLEVTQTYLRNHFAAHQIESMSLRALIETAIPLKPPSEDSGWVSSDLLRIFGVGKKGFFSVVNRLTKLDLGSRFNAEWRLRLVMLRRR